MPLPAPTSMTVLPANDGTELPTMAFLCEVRAGRERTGGRSISLTSVAGRRQPCPGGAGKRPTCSPSFGSRPRACWPVDEREADGSTSVGRACARDRAGGRTMGSGPGSAGTSSSWDRVVRSEASAGSTRAVAARMRLTQSRALRRKASRQGGQRFSEQEGSVEGWQLALVQLASEPEGRRKDGPSTWAASSLAWPAMGWAGDWPGMAGS